MDNNKQASDAIIQGMRYVVNQYLNNNSTKIYDGIIMSSSTDNKYNIKYNGEIHSVKLYGDTIPQAGQIVKVIVPQGNQSLAWFFIGSANGDPSGSTSTVFIPSVSSDGIISWTNDGGLPNPTPVNIKGPQGEAGPQGEMGEQGIQGIQGEQGYYFTPSVDDSGNLSWTNNGNLPNPSIVNIKGPQGIAGEKGQTGDNGINATINGVSALILNTTGGLLGSQNENTYTISGENLPIKFQSNMILNNEQWTPIGTLYYQQITLDGITSNSAPILIPQWDDNASIKENQKNEWNKLVDVQSFDGYIQIFSSSPIESVTISFLIYY